MSGKNLPFRSASRHESFADFCLSQQFAGSTTFRHNLTPIQIEHKKKEFQKCKERGVEPTECAQCKKDTMYMYMSFEKRGGTKYLHCCASCYYSFSKLIVSEEDYDFLAN